MAEKLLHEFACWCAERALQMAKIDDVRYWQAIAVKRKWLRGEASDAQLAAAKAAAKAAAWAEWFRTARSAHLQWDPAKDAAWAAAKDSARDSAKAAAWGASLVAARMLRGILRRSDRIAC